MKCVKCDHDSKKSQRLGGCCPACGERFGLDPQNGDLITDMQLKRAIERVSASGRVRFFPKHVYYEVLRRSHKKARRTGFVLIPVIVVIAGIAAASILHAGPMLFVLALCALSAWLAALAARGIRGTSAALPEATFNGYFRSYAAAHGEPAGLIKASPPRAAKAGAIPSELLEYSFDRAVICDKPETVDVLLANQFHFENNCAVLGVDGYPAAAFETVRTMLRNNPRLLVLALHDADAEGCRLAYRLRRDRAWFEGRARVVDVGLRPHQAKAWRPLWTTSAEIVVESPSISRAEADWLSSHRLELAAITPEQLVKRLYRSMLRAEEPEASSNSDSGTASGGEAWSSHHGSDSDGDAAGRHGHGASDSFDSDVDAGVSDGGADSFG